jgi:hypothetical protein
MQGNIKSIKFVFLSNFGFSNSLPVGGAYFKLVSPFVVIRTLMRIKDFVFPGCVHKCISITPVVVTTVVAIKLMEIYSALIKLLLKRF